MKRRKNATESLLSVDITVLSGYTGLLEKKNDRCYSLLYLSILENFCWHLSLIMGCM